MLPQIDTLYYQQKEQGHKGEQMYCSYCNFVMHVLVLYVLLLAKRHIYG